MRAGCGCVRWLNVLSTIIGLLPMALKWGGGRAVDAYASFGARDSGGLTGVVVLNGVPGSGGVGEGLRRSIRHENLMIVFVGAVAGAQHHASAIVADAGSGWRGQHPRLNAARYTRPRCAGARNQLHGGV